MKLNKLLGLALGLGVLAIAVSCKQEATYVVKFVDYDDTVLQEVSLEAGELPNYTLDEPVREGNAQYSYTFTGWDKDFKVVDGDTTYKATYDESINSYRVTFKDDVGKVLDTQILEYGSIPTYKRNEPTKEAKDEHTYKFDGWDKELKEVTSDVTYTAKFKELTNAYTVSFIDLSGGVLYEADFEYGSTPTYKGETPTLEGNEKYSYVFAGWTEELKPVEQDTTYRVKFNQVVNKYEIKFYDEDLNLLETKKVDYGQVPVFTGTLPELPSNTAMYAYSGNWDKELTSVTKDDIYVYEINRVKNKYKVTFVNHDDTVLFEEEYEYGVTPSYDGEIPTKEPIVSEAYVFDGWDKTLVPVSSNITYKAVYDSVVAKYLIKFVDEDGNLLDSQEVEYGQVPAFNGTLPETPLGDAQYSYSPSWDKKFKQVSGDNTYTYLFNKTVNSYEVTINHLYLDGSVAAPQVKETKLFNELESYSGVYTYTAPAVEGYVPSHDYVKYTVDGNKVINVYYSEVDTLTSETVASTSLSGEGTQENPYLISSAADLLCFKNNIATYGASGKYVKMTKSIDLNNIAFIIPGTYSGTFDGNNCSIRDFKLDTNTQKQALFYVIGSAGTVKNLSIYGKVESGVQYVATLAYQLSGAIDNCTNYCDVNSKYDYSLSTETSAAYQSHVGGLVCRVHANSKLKNSTNYGNITALGNRVGGIAAYAESTGAKISNCINYGNISTTHHNAAGILGYCQGSGTIIDECRNYGAVSTTSTSTTSEMGGIVAYASIGGVSNCINYGSVSSKGYSGSIVGRFNNADKTITNCYNYGLISGGTFNLNNKVGYENIGSLVAYNRGNATPQMFVNCYDYGTINKI